MKNGGVKHGSIFQGLTENGKKDKSNRYILFVSEEGLFEPFVKFIRVERENGLVTK